MPSQLLPAAFGDAGEDPLADTAALLEFHRRALALARSLDPVLDEILSEQDGPGSRPKSTPTWTGTASTGLLTSLRMLVYIRAEARRLGTQAIDLAVVDTCIEYLSRRYSDPPPRAEGDYRSLH
jgi:hypothetical protein